MENVDWIMLMILTPCAIIDWKERRIGIKWIAIVLLISVGLAAVYKKEVMQSLFGMMPGFVLLILSAIFPKSIGIADGSIVAAIGIIKGLWDCLLLVFFALFLISAISILLLAVKKVGKKSEIPFIPFLSGAYFILCVIG